MARLCVVCLCCSLLAFVSGCNKVELSNDITPSTVGTATPDGKILITPAMLPTVMLTATPVVSTPTTISPPTATSHLDRPTPAPTYTTTPILTPTAQVSEEETWQVHHNTEYGFSFRYPDQLWTLVERPDDKTLLALAYKEMGIALRFRFKRSGEEGELHIYGGAAGDFVSRGTVDFLGERVERYALVFRGVDKAIHYNRAREIQRGDLVFMIGLVSNRSNYEEAVVPEAVQAEAEQVLKTFELTE